MNFTSLVPLATFGLVSFSVWLAADLLTNSGRSTSHPLRIFVGVGLVLALFTGVAAWPARCPVISPVVAPIITPRSLFEETRMGVTRDDVRGHLHDMEKNVPAILHDMEKNVPDVMRRMKSEMMSNACKYGLSSSDVDAQMQEIESRTHQQIRDMEPEVRQNIRNMEEPVWENLRRIEQGN